jgi:hypothetical protein
MEEKEWKTAECTEGDKGKEENWRGKHFNVKKGGKRKREMIMIVINPSKN